jgi:hypothetical protein
MLPKILANFFFIFLKGLIMASKFYSSLSKDLSLMLDCSDDHNVIIQVGENPNIKEFCAHSNILIVDRLISKIYW